MRLELCAILLIAAPALGQCPPPANFVATQGTLCTGVGLSWSAVAHVTSYGLVRNTSPTLSGATSLGSTANTTFLDSNAIPGRLYYYWVAATGTLCGGTGTPSGPVSGTRSTTPDVVTGVAASDADVCGGVQVVWNAVAYATSYDLWRGVSSDLQQAQFLDSTSGTQYLDTTALPMGVAFGPYYYWVRATNSCGHSALSGPDQGSWADVSGLPDLIVNQGTMSNWAVIGNGTTLSFNTRFSNVGSGPLHLLAGASYPDGTRDVWQQVCLPGEAMHLVGRFPGQSSFSLAPVIRYRLRERPGNQSVGESVAESSLSTFCLWDLQHSYPATPGSPSAAVYTCTPNLEGMSIGWGIEYGSAQPGQSLSLSCAHNGDYWIEAEINPTGIFVESSTANNVYRVPVTLAGVGPGNGFTFTSQPAGRVVCAGGTAQFSIAVSAAAPTYAWYKGEAALSDGPTASGSVVSGAASTTLSISGLRSPDGGVYSCIVTSGSCARASGGAELRVNSADFNGDGNIGTDADIASFFACLGGNCCPTCGTADFNGDGNIGTDADIESFFRVLGGGPC